MNRKQIRQHLTKKNNNKIHNYFEKQQNVKQVQSDLMNLLQSWLHCLLYHKRMYPQDAFQVKNILGIPIHTASSPKLKSYLDGFFKKFRQHVEHINHLQVVIYNVNFNSIIQVNTIHIHDILSQTQLNQGQFPPEKENSLLKQIKIKGFLHELQQKLKSGYIRKQSDNVNFKLRIGYRYQTYDSKNNQLLNGWILKDRIQGESQIECSLKTPQLNLIFQTS